MMANGDDIQDRLIAYAARIIKVSNALPRTMAGRHVSGQLLRSGTAPAAHYAEAREAESTSDFIHKLKIAVKELNESEVWLRIVVDSSMLTQAELSHLLDESNQLQKILSASIGTARKSDVDN
jgi:four helix bundle protein